MRRFSLVDNRGVVTQALAKYGEAIAAVRKARQIPRADIDAAIETTRRTMSDAELRKLSPQQLEERATAALQRIAVTRLRQLPKGVNETHSELQLLIHNSERKARRLLPPADENGDPLQALHQELVIQRLERRFASLTPRERVAALEDAQTSGDDLAAFVLDETLLYELPRLKAEGGSSDELMRATNDIAALRTRFQTLEEARLTPQERELLTAWRAETSAFERDWMHESHLIEAILHRGSIDLEVIERIPEGPETAAKRHSAFAVEKLQGRVQSGDEAALSALRRLGIKPDEWMGQTDVATKFLTVDKALQELTDPGVRGVLRWDLFQTAAAT